ncbi:MULTISPECIES: PCYCGC motif-containing (lipo)protein [Paenibacillus]|uniref:PCYCGC motif-containing (lipo)protein n=1 Tax=Paenibacillus TaxID=44249 RepID=UPI0038731DAA
MGLALPLVMAASLTACGAKEAAEKPAVHAAAHHGDIQETTASLDILPSFLASQPEQTRLIYGIAAKNIDRLQWIPCYCGCGESAGHLSNKNCFIKEVRSDGQVVWDDHGTRCGVCMEIAVKTAKLTAEGKTLKEIRAQIDAEYAKGYAKPTPTPMPS